MTIPSVTQPGTGPDRVQAPDDYDAQTTAYRIAFNSSVAELNAAIAEINVVSVQISEDALAAAAAASVATTTANADKWVSGSSYDEGDQVWSPVTFLVYRAKTTHSGVATDPSADTTNWTEAVGAGYAPLFSPAFTGNPTCPDQVAVSNNLRVANTRFVQSAIDLKVPAPLEEDTISAATAEVVYEMTGHARYKLTIRGLRPPSDTSDVQMQFGSDASTFYSGFSDYIYSKSQDGTEAYDASSNRIVLAEDVRSDAVDAGVDLELIISPSADGSTISKVQWSGGHKNGYIIGAASMTDDPVSHIRIYCASGSIQAAYLKMEGMD